MNPVTGKECPSPGGEQVMVRGNVDHEITRIEVTAQLLKQLFDIRSPLHEHQHGAGGTELSGEFLDGPAECDGQSPDLLAELPDPAGIGVIACHGNSAAGDGESQVAIEEAESDDTESAACGGAHHTMGNS